MPTKKYITFESIGGAEVRYVCPHCGYDGVRFPTRPEAWHQYEEDGTLTLRQDVVQIEHIHCLAERDVFMPLAVYIPACVLSGTMALAQLVPWQMFEGVLVGGAIGVLLFAVRYRQGVAEPKQAPAVEPETIPQITEAHIDKSVGPGHLFRFSKAKIVYLSGAQVPDYHLWEMARSVRLGVPFSRALYTGDTKCTTRPAFEALRSALITSRMAYMDGQDVILKASGRSVLRQWATLDRPPITD